jgi:hypothetical protein
MHKLNLIYSLLGHIAKKTIMKLMIFLKTNPFVSVPILIHIISDGLTEGLILPFSFYLLLIKFLHFEWFVFVEFFGNFTLSYSFKGYPYKFILNLKFKFTDFFYILKSCNSFFLTFIAFYISNMYYKSYLAFFFSK